MDIRHVTMEVDDIVVDHDVMVRDCLDESWVKELAALYEDRHKIDPILVMKDQDGVTRLVHGFYRVAALKMCGYSGVTAEVREGSKDQAMVLACKADPYGTRRTSQEHSKAVLRVHSSPEGRLMSSKSLSLYCGVPEWAITQMLSGGKPVLQPRTVYVENTTPSVRKGLVELYARVDLALRANPHLPNQTLAGQIGCDRRLVKLRREELNISKPKVKPRQQHESHEKILQILKEEPNLRINVVAQRAGVHPSTVKNVKKKCLTLRNDTSDSESAPERKNDPRLSFEEYRAR